MNITCSALPEQLLESELFGHERGAFTDARQQKRGLFETADGGTVFLDEIGEMTPGLQSKLLRFLEEKTFSVGGLADIRVRVIAATNRNLEEEVKAGKFREDLFYRLQVMPILLPALRERRGDVLLLANFYINRYNSEFQAWADARRAGHAGAVSLARQCSRGRNAIERAMLLADRTGCRRTTLRRYRGRHRRRRSGCPRGRQPRRSRTATAGAGTRPLARQSDAGRRAARDQPRPGCAIGSRSSA